MPLGLGSNLSKTGLTTPGIVTDNLVLKHKYDAGSVVPISDGAAYFVKTNTDYIEIPDNSNLSFGDGSNDSAFSISAWIYPKDVDRFRIVTKSTASKSEWVFTLNNANKPCLFLYDDVIGQQEGRIGTAITANQWYHITATYNGVGGTSANAGINIYVNGALDNAELSDAGSYTAMHNDTGGAVRIGNFQDSGTSVDYADGYICNVGIWSSVLTQPQVKSIMNKNYAGLTDSEKTNLVSWWNLDSAYDIDDTTESTETTQYVFDNHHGGGDTLGSDVMAGGDMSSDSGWNLDSGWSISNGKLVCETSSFNTAYKTTSGLTEGKLYKVTVDVATTNGNPLLIYLGEGHSGSVTANVRGRTQTTGTNVFYLVAGATNQIYFYAGSVSARWNGTIDNVIIQEVNGNHGVLS